MSRPVVTYVAVTYVVDCQSAAAMSLVVIVRVLSSKANIHSYVRTDTHVLTSVFLNGARCVITFVVILTFYHELVHVTQ